MRRLAYAALLVTRIAAVGALGWYHAVYIGDYPFANGSRLAWYGAYAVMLFVAAYAVGLPDLARTRRTSVLASLAAVAAAALAISAIQLVTGSRLLPRFVVFGAPMALVPIDLVLALAIAGRHESAQERTRVLFVGGEDEAAALRDDLTHRPERPASIVRVMPVADTEGDATSRPLVAQAAESRASVVVLNRAAQAVDSIVAQAAELHESGVRVRTLGLFYEEWLGKLPLSELERMSLMFDIGELHRLRYNRLKRVVDVVLAIGGLVALAVAIPIVAIADVIANRGPLFYRQQRVGRYGESYGIIKFRTMRPALPTDPTAWTTNDDPRVTPFGRILRRSHLDELPQVINIFMGDQSVVGPRPEQPLYVDELTQKLPFYGLRHLVSPGLTGWAQVKFGYAATELDAMEKLQYEFYYLRHQSLTLDLRIIGRTVRSVIGRRGR